MSARRLVLIVVFSALFLSTTACAGSAPADTSTPEGTVRLYLQHIQGGDMEAAHELLGDDLHEDCPQAGFRDQGPSAREQLRDARVLIRRVTIDNDRATVVATVNSGRTDFGPLGPRGGYSYEEHYSLAFSDGEWQFRNLAWPVHWCGERFGTPEAPPPRAPATPALRGEPASAGEETPA